MSAAGIVSIEFRSLDDRERLLLIILDSSGVKQISDVIDQFAQLDMRRMTLDGREPLAHPDIEQVVDKLSTRGIRIWMNTNAILIPRGIELAKKLS